MVGGQGLREGGEVHYVRVQDAHVVVALGKNISFLRKVREIGSMF